MRIFVDPRAWIVLSLLLVAGTPPVANSVNHPLPDPLQMADGTPVSTPEQWRDSRRPELKELFQKHVYGYLPPHGPIKATVKKTVPDLLDGRATLKEVDIEFPFLKCANPPVLHLAVVTPNAAQGPVPLFLALNRRGNHGILPDKRITPTPNANDDQFPSARGEGEQTWCVAKLIDRGYGFATFVIDDIDPDKHDFTDGLHACLTNEGVPAESRPGTIAAWAWGIHRAVDYLVTDKAIDPKRIAAIGHSRRGKTVLFATAMDERIALVVPHQSGTGGMALSRNNNQETVARINKVFPHWFADRFNEYNENEAALPVDQHMLVALVAPRPVLDTAGLQDEWANFESALLNLKAADPVYKLLGTPGLVGEGKLTKGDAINAKTAGPLLQYRLDLKHVLTDEYWEAILDFADLQFGRTQIRSE